MELTGLLKDKSVKPKEKTEAIATALLNKDLALEDLIKFAGGAKDPDKATCIEATEFATKQQASLANQQLLDFVSAELSCKAPRVKWESAKVIGNIAHLFPKKLDKAIAGLLVNTEDKGTVVRWAAAFALGEIIKLNTIHNKDLLPAVEAIIKREEKKSIQKIYLAALKKLTKA